MIPVAIPNLSGNEGKYLEECIKTGFVSSIGPYVTKFEALVAKSAGVKYASAVSSGTAALHLALLSVGVESGDLVIVPSFTFIASANAVSHCGAIPWLFDVDKISWTLDANLLGRVLRDETSRRAGKLIHKPTGRRVAAVMPVYTLGTIADMEQIRKITVKYDLPLVADAACAIGAEYRGRPVGTQALLTVFSFNGNKTVTSGGGGMVVGNDRKLLKAIEHMSTAARVGSEFHHDRVAYNYRMTNLQAAVGCAQMEQLEQFIRKKQKVRIKYDTAFAGIDGVGAFPQPGWSESTSWLSGIVVDSPALPGVKQLCMRLRKRGIEARTFWKPMHLQSPYRDAPRTSVAVSDGIWKKILILPCSTKISAAEQNFVIKTVKEQFVRAGLAPG